MTNESKNELPKSYVEACYVILQALGDIRSESRFMLARTWNLRLKILRLPSVGEQAG